MWSGGNFTSDFWGGGVDPTSKDGSSPWPGAGESLADKSSSSHLAPGPPPIVSAFGDTVWGDGAVLIISKNLPLKGKFFEMVSRALPPGGSGGLGPLRNLR